MARAEKARYAVGAVADLDKAGCVIDALRAARVEADLATLIGSSESLAIRAHRAEAPPEALACREFRVCGNVAGCERERAFLPPLARMTEGAAAGGVPLRAAFGEWIPARHAAQLDRSLREGRILVWVPLLVQEDEIATCQALLRYGCDAVQIHDLSRLQRGSGAEPRVNASGWSARC